MLNITRTKKPAEMSLAELRAERERNEREEREDRARMIEATKARKQAEREQAEQVSRTLAGIAALANVQPGGLLAAVKLKATTGATSALWESIVRLTWAYSDQNAQTVMHAIEAVHVLASIGELAKPRKDDPVFGSIDRIRTLPEMADASLKAIDAAGWYEAFVNVAGIGLPQEPAVDLAEYHRQREEIEAARERWHYAPKDGKLNSERAARERSLLDDDLAQQRAAALRVYQERLRTQRLRILAAIDRELVDRKIDVAWWWARELRRHVAGERRQIDDTLRVWHSTQHLGVRFNFEGI